MARAIAALLAWAFLTVTAHAQVTQGFQLRLGSANACGSWPGDGGCLGSLANITNAATIQPTFAYDSAQSGQLSSTPTTGDIAIRNGLLHKNGKNVASVDYAIGSAPPSSLPGINTFAGDGICVPHASGYPLGGGPYIGCLGQNVTETLANFDLTNNGAGTGTACVPVFINGNNTGSTYHFINLNIQASGTCFTNNGALFDFASGASTPPSLIDFQNVTIDCNYSANGTTAANITGIIDNRTGPTPGVSWPITGKYNVIKNCGLRPISGNNSAGIDWEFSRFDNNCLAGVATIHCEVTTFAGANSTRTDKYLGNLYYAPSVQTTVVDTTSAFHMTSGQTNNTNYTSATAQDNLVIIDLTACTNAGPYSPTNPCAGGTASGEGLFDIGSVAAVQNLHIHGNVIDATGSVFCYSNANSISQTGFLAQMTAIGTVLTVTSPTGGGAPYVNTGTIFTGNIAVGMLVTDTHTADGFVPTTITSFGSYTNSGTTGVSGSCAIGTNAGCGTLNLGSSEPTTASQNTWSFVANVVTPDYGADNWSIGGSSQTARLITFGSQPWGNVICP